MKYKYISAFFVFCAVIGAVVVSSRPATATSTPAVALPCVAEVEDPELPVDGEIESEEGDIEPETEVTP